MLICLYTTVYVACLYRVQWIECIVCHTKIFPLTCFQLGYLASIIQLGINVGGDQLETFWNSTVLTTQVYSECGTTNYNDTWRCATLKDVGLGEK